MKTRKTKNVPKLRRILTKMKPEKTCIINGKPVTKTEKGKFEILITMKLEHTVKLLTGKSYFVIKYEVNNKKEA